MRRLPAEWEPQSGVMLTWPHTRTPWAYQLARVDVLYAELAAAISRFESVLIVCQSQEHAGIVRPMALAAGTDPNRLGIALASSDDTWARDHGPIGVLDGDSQPILIDFSFNGWGRKFPFDLDNAINARLHAAGAYGSCALEVSPLVLEGGAIDSDGRGTLLMMERTLVDPQRNPGLPRHDVERELMNRLGTRHFLWLRHGFISGDDTDGHIDTLARFCGPETICYVRSQDPSDPDCAGLAAMEEELRTFRDAAGDPYRLVPLPCPQPIVDENGKRLPAGYANFLIINDAVLLPVYGDPADARAYDILQDLFPDRAILTLDCRPLIRHGGSLHCITMQFPLACQIGA